MKFPSGREYKSGHSVELLRSGESYFAACEKAINEATKYIHFQTYIVDDDETGRRFVEAMIRASERGVRVYFLLDAYGGGSFSKELTEMVEHVRNFIQEIFTRVGYQRVSVKPETSS